MSRISRIGSYFRDRFARPARSIGAILVAATLAPWVAPRALAADDAAANAASCALGRPVNLAGMGWDGNAIMTAIVAEILWRGYGCESEIVPGETLAAVIAMDRGEVDVILEAWGDALPDVWRRRVADGGFRILGAPIYSGVGEGWFVPAYTKDRHPSLNTIADLARDPLKTKKIFADPSDPSKGAVIGCVASWRCAAANLNLMKALGLMEHFNPITPESGDGLEKTILELVSQKKDFVTYYWTPTTLVAEADLTILGSPGFEAEIYRCNSRVDCESPGITSFLPKTVVKAATRRFVENAPRLTAFISNVTMRAKTLSGLLLEYRNAGLSPKEFAVSFLNERRGIWSDWPEPEIANKIADELRLESDRRRRPR